jgi:hypothetical protein
LMSFSHALISSMLISSAGNNKFCFAPLRIC